MAQSSDEYIKREIIDVLGTTINGCKLRIYPGSSNEDQLVFDNDGGLTFGINYVPYGSNDAAWTLDEEWVNPFNGATLSVKPVVVLEGTDALNRKSGGNAQYQRFHHALGAVKSGLIGVYYLKRGKKPILPDLYGMAYHATLREAGTYLIYDCLEELKDLFRVIHNPAHLEKYIDTKLISMKKIYLSAFDRKYVDWDNFSRKRSTIIKDKYVIKHAGRMRRNFTDGSQRAGHIALGEMYLTKYFFEKKHFFYLWPKMSREDIAFLDNSKKTDKEWNLIRNEDLVTVLAIDDLIGVPYPEVQLLKKIQHDPLKGQTLIKYKSAVKIIDSGLRDGSIKINEMILSRLDLM